MTLGNATELDLTPTPRGRDELPMVAEVDVEPARAALAPQYREILRNKLGIQVGVEFAAPGEQAELTGIETRQMPVRLIDRRWRKG